MIDSPERLARIAAARKRLLLYGAPGRAKDDLLAAVLDRLDCTGTRREVAALSPATGADVLLGGSGPAGAGPVLRAIRAAERESEATHVLVLRGLDRVNLGLALGETLRLLDLPRTASRLLDDGTRLILPDNLIVIATVEAREEETGTLPAVLARRFPAASSEPAIPPPKARDGDPRRTAAGGLARLARCPPPVYHALEQGSRSDDERALARAGRFSIFQTVTELNPPIDWGSGADPRPSHRARLHSLAWLDSLLYAYSAAADLAALRQALVVVLDWLRARPTDPLAWAPRVAAQRTAALTFGAVAGAREALLDDEVADDVFAALAAHGAFLADPANHRNSNHGLTVDAGLLVLARGVPVLPAARAWERLARRRLAGLVSRQVDVVSGAHLEHSPEYQVLIAHLVGVIAGLLPDEPAAGRLHRRMDRPAAWLTLPDGALAQFGDSDLDAPAWTGEPAADGLSDLRHVGFCVARRGRSALAVSCSYTNPAHKHADELSFELVESGVRVVADTGKYGYETHPRRSFARSARAHSTLTVNGEDFPLPYRAYGTGLRAQGAGHGWYAVVGVNALLIDAGVRHRRWFVYRPGAILTLIDEVDAEAEVDIDRRIQLGPRIEVRERGPCVLLDGPRFAGAIIDIPAPGIAERTLTRGATDPLQGWTFPRPGGQAARWTVELHSRAQRAVYVTVLGLAGHGVPAATARVDDDRLALDLGAPGLERTALELTLERRDIIIRCAAPRSR